ncbi:MAG: cbb3-type cytochrome c oxidase subunit I, partial [Acidimicrobiales bacterium]
MATITTEERYTPELPSAPRRLIPWLPRPNFLTGVIGGIVGYIFGHWAGNAIASGWTRYMNNSMNDVALTLGYLVATFGFLVGLGIFNYPFAKIFGRAPALEKLETTGLARYFRYTPDHKVVGWQYLIGMLIYFFTGGMFALAIRTELLSPHYHVFGPDTYISIVGLHGTMMMMMMTSVIVGPFGNYFVPLMIGAKRMAFPR